MFSENGNNPVVARPARLLTTPNARPAPAKLQQECAPGAPRGCFVAVAMRAWCASSLCVAALMRLVAQQPGLSAPLRIVCPHGVFGLPQIPAAVRAATGRRGGYSSNSCRDSSWERPSSSRTPAWLGEIPIVFRQRPNCDWYNNSDTGWH